MNLNKKKPPSILYPIVLIQWAILTSPYLFNHFNVWVAIINFIFTFTLAIKLFLDK